MKVYELEDAILQAEGIQVFIRAPRNTVTDLSYSYERACPRGTTLAGLRRGRLAAIGELYEYEVIDGNHETPNGKTKLSTIRESYSK